jgi:hypothetical protein
MIAKSLILFILIILLSDAILWHRYFRQYRWWIQVLWFVPSLLLVAATIYLALEPDFVPDDMTFLNSYLLLMGLITLPKALTALCALCRRSAWKIGACLTPVVWFVILYGSFWGNHQFEVKHVELSFSDLPKSFDGFRIVQFSDVHLGSIRSSLLQEVIDSINAQQADLVVFTGDLQNKQPKEILPHQKVLSTIKSPHGVISVLGNHDYPEYIQASLDEKAFLKEMLIGNQQDMGWSVLINGRRIIEREGDSLIIAGLDNDGEGRFPQKGNINRALWGISRQSFVVMLEHDPSAWRRKILPHCHAQLTLSGHTHGMQFELFGWSPLSVIKKDVDGLSEVGGRYLYVSKGVGGVVPFRFGATPEIVVFTLRRQS